jgi:hypothetical protein
MNIKYIHNTVLYVATAHSLDYRFAHPTSFLNLILIVYGFSNILKNKPKIMKNKTVSITIINIILFSFSILLIWIYNS